MRILVTGGAGSLARRLGKIIVEYAAGRSGEQRHVQADLTRAQQLLSGEPRKSFEAASPLRYAEYRWACQGYHAPSRTVLGSNPENPSIIAKHHSFSMRFRELSVILRHC